MPSPRRKPWGRPHTKQAPSGAIHTERGKLRTTMAIVPPLPGLGDAPPRQPHGSRHGLRWYRPLSRAVRERTGRPRTGERRITLREPSPLCTILPAPLRSRLQLPAPYCRGAHLPSRRRSSRVPVPSCLRASWPPIQHGGAATGHATVPLRRPVACLARFLTVAALFRRGCVGHINSVPSIPKTQIRIPNS